MRQFVLCRDHRQPRHIPMWVYYIYKQVDTNAIHAIYNRA